MTQSTKEVGHMWIKHSHVIVVTMSYMSTFVSSQSRVAHSPSMQGVTDTTEIQTSGLQTPSLYPVGQLVQHLVTATSTVYVCEYLGKHIYEIGLGLYRSRNDSVVTVIPVREAKQLRGITTLCHEILFHFVTDRGSK